MRQLKEPVCEGTLIGKICRPLQALLAERSLSVGYFCIAEYGVYFAQLPRSAFVFQNLTSCSLQFYALHTATCETV